MTLLAAAIFVNDYKYLYTSVEMNRATASNFTKSERAI